jgi:hypothetical protein
LPECSLLKIRIDLIGPEQIGRERERERRKEREDARDAERERKQRERQRKKREREKRQERVRDHGGQQTQCKERDWSSIQAVAVNERKERDRREV